MKSIRQLLRQPMKTLFGVILIALAVAMLCVCLGQSLAAAKTQARLNDIFMSLSLPALNYTKEADAWALSFAEEHPEIVKDVGSPGLVAAYIPELTPDNYTSHLYMTQSMNMNFTLCPNLNESEYTSAMLEIQLTEVTIPEPPLKTFVKIDGRDYSYETQNTTITLKGTIQSVIGLAEGFCDPTGFSVSIFLFTTQDQVQNLDLRVGERYLVYTTDYFDNDWWLRSYMTQNVPGLDGELIGSFDPEQMSVFSHKEIEEFNGSNDLNNLLQIVAKYHFQEENLTHGMERWTMDYFRTVSMNIEDETAVINYKVELGSDGKISATPMDTYSYTDKSGEVFTIPMEEYRARYAEPTIVHLNGSVEEFLASSDGELWREALRNIEINSNAFPVIGVDDLDYIAEFARGWSEIAAGRTFSDEDLESGTNVCIISETLAQLNGLSVGDTIHPQFYSNDQNLPYQINISHRLGSVNPMAYYYFERTSSFCESSGEYTIIGLYKQDAERGNVDNNLYAFTPNTIFVPKTSVSAEMDYGYAAFFRTFVLVNGKMEEFAEAAAEAGFADQFFYDDNGYSSVGDGVESYQNTARRALIIALVAYGIILLLFLVLYPAQQGKNLATMESLGATRQDRIGHVLFNSLGILIPGMVIGVAGGMLMWQHVAKFLAREADASLDISMDAAMLGGIGAVQLGTALLLTSIIAYLLTGKKSLMKRK